MQILSSLIFNDDYIRKTIPYINKDYFKDTGHQVTLKLIKDHFAKYNKLPTTSSLLIDLNASGLNELVFERTKEIITNLTNEEVDLNWLVDTTEEFCKKQAFYNAVSESAQMLDAKNSDEYGKALDLVKEALSVSFDNYIGHDYIENAEERFESYRRKEQKMPCDLDMFNKSTGGGFVEQSMVMFMAPTGIGKSLVMCHFASSYLTQGFNVLYITLEMSEKQVAQRIDAHLLDIPILDLKDVEKSTYMSRMLRLQKKTLGKLIVKEYPAHTAHSGHFRHLINDLRLKKNFSPHVIIVDYLGICGSARAPKGANTHDLLKIIAEEIRSLGQEFNCRTMSAQQVNREGTKSNDFDLTDVAGSWGIPQTVDYMYGIYSTDEQEEMGQLTIRRLKDRHNDMSVYKKFAVGVIRNKMRLHDLDKQDDDADDRPVFDRGQFASAEKKNKFESLLT